MDPIGEHEVSHFDKKDEEDDKKDGTQKEKRSSDSAGSKSTFMSENRGRTPFRDESLDGQQTGSKRDSYSYRYHHQDEDKDVDTMESEKREARPRFPSLSTGLNWEGEAMEGNRYRPPGGGGHRQLNSTAQSFTARGGTAVPSRFNKRSNSITRTRAEDSQRADLRRKMNQTRSEQLIMKNSSLMLSGGIQVRHSSRNMLSSHQPSATDADGTTTKLSRRTRPVSRPEGLTTKPSQQTMQTGMAGGFYSMGMFGCSIDLPLFYVKPSVTRMQKRRNLMGSESGSLDSADGDLRSMVYQGSKRRFSASAKRTPKMNQSIRSLHSRRDSQSSYAPITMIPDGSSVLGYMPMVVQGSSLENMAVEDDDLTVKSYDVVNSCSEADSSAIPSPSAQKVLTCVPEDGEYTEQWTEQWDTLLDEDEEPEKTKMTCEQIRYAIAIFFVRFLHTGFLDLDVITFVREMDELGHDSLWVISLRFGSSFITSIILICWLCTCYGNRILHMRSWVAVFITALLNFLGCLWAVCDEYSEQLQLYIFLVLLKGIFYCEGGAVAALITCVVFPPHRYHLIRAIDLLGIICGDLAIGCFCSEIYKTLKLTYTSLVLAVLGILGTILLAFLVPYHRMDAIPIITCRQGILKDKFDEFGKLLKIPQILITCFMMISVNLVLYSGGFIYNTHFIKLYGNDDGAMYYTIYWGVASVASAALTLTLGFIKDPGKYKSYVVLWVCGALPPLFCYLTEPPEGAGYGDFPDKAAVKIVGLVIISSLTVPFRVFSMCIVRYYVVPELICNVCLLLNLADMLGRCVTPVVLQALYTGLDAAWTLMICALLHLFFILIDVIICVVDAKKQAKLEKTLQEEEALAQKEFLDAHHQQNEDLALTAINEERESENRL